MVQREFTARKHKLLVESEIRAFTEIIFGNYLFLPQIQSASKELRKMVRDRKKQRRGTKGGRRLTVGFILGGLEERYQSQLWPSFVSAAEEFDLNLILFPGGPLNIPVERYGHIAQRNVIYDLIHPNNLDGLVILSGTLTGFVDGNAFHRFCEQFEGLPIVSLFIQLTEAHSILLDNKKGMYDLVDHLINTHNCQQIGFIRGPEGHQEADERFQAYADALTSNGIPFNMDFVIPGEFTATSSKQGLQKFFDSKNIQFDAIVAANDRMAVGAFEFFQSRGLEIPKDITIVGFDDIEESRYTLPPLTTVRQPYRQIARIAIETLCRYFNGEITQKEIILPTELVIRQSCGCTISQKFLKQSKPHESKATPGLSTLIAQRSLITDEIIKRVATNLRGQQIAIEFQAIATLFDAFIESLYNIPSNKFLTVLEDLLNQNTKKNNSVRGWEEIVSVSQDETTPYITDPKLCHYSKKLWLQARIMIGEFAERAQAHQRYQMILRTLLISEISQELLSTFEVKKLMDVLYQNLSSLGIESCFVAIYENFSKSGGLARLILAFNQQQRYNLEPEGILFPANELIPAGISLADQRRNWVVSPLYFQTDHLGFLIMEIGPYDGMVYEAIRRYVSSALKGALILEERIQAENQLIQYRDFLEDRVNERTKELNEINIQLQQEIIERKQAEDKFRILSEELEARVHQRTNQLENANQNLESFSYSVSHDLRAPLRAITGFSTILLEDYLGELSTEAQSFLLRIDSQAKQMNQLILDLLAFSRIDRQELNKQSVNCTALAQRVLDELRAEQFADCEAETNIAEMPACQADPALLKQVFVNLISNAMKFSCNGTKPLIHIFSEHKNGKDIYIIKDNGVGFDPQYQDKLFVVFQRLHDSKEFEGTGVGLAIVKRIITRHGGQIWAESSVNQGATFYFTVE